MDAAYWGSHLCPRPAATTEKPAARAQFDEVTDHRRLVSVSETVDDPGVRSSLREKWPTQSVRFHGHVDHMLSLAESLKRVLHGSDRISSSFNHDIDSGVCHQAPPVFAKMRSPRVERVIKRSCRIHARIPTDSVQILARIAQREIRDSSQMHARRARNLRQIHGAKFAGADQADSKRLTLRLPM